MSDDNSKTDRLLDSFGTRAEDKEGLIDALELLGGLSDAEARAAVDEYLTGSWRRKGQSRAEGLVTGATDPRLPEDERTRPWTPGLHMDVRARGALVSRDRELHRSVGDGGYANQVYGNRHVKSGFEHSVFSKDRTVVVQGMEGLGSDILPDVRFGRDRLDVAEDAEMKWRSRTTLMSGTLTRRYLGGFIKAAPMEGVICGGALVRTIGGPSANLSGLCSGDVYGGAARVALARTRIGLLHYRAAVGAAWSSVFYGRVADFVIDAPRLHPADGTHEQRRKEAGAALEDVRRRADGLPARRHRRGGDRPRRGTGLRALQAHPQQGQGQAPAPGDGDRAPAQDPREVGGTREVRVNDLPVRCPDVRFDLRHRDGHGHARCLQDPALRDPRALSRHREQRDVHSRLLHHPHRRDARSEPALHVRDHAGRRGGHHGGRGLAGLHRPRPPGDGFPGGFRRRRSRVAPDRSDPAQPMQRAGLRRGSESDDQARPAVGVLSDTIEGRIFLLLDDKLTEIGRTLGKVDAHGNVAEDLRSQILGQLAEGLNYHRLYQEALDDPELKRTSIELETALANAREAREVVFDLFQDLDGFSLDDYTPFADVSSSLEHLVDFMAGALERQEQRLARVDDQTLQVLDIRGRHRKTFTLDRDTATANDEVDLLGLDHPLVHAELDRWGNLQPEDLGIAVRGNGAGPAMLSLWRVETTNGAGERRTTVQPIAVSRDGTRAPGLERQLDRVMRGEPAKPALNAKQRLELFSKVVEPTLQRELKHKGSASGEGSYAADLIGYLELT